MSKLFALRGTLSRRTGRVIEVIGACVLVLLWWTIVKLGLIHERILPSPFSVLSSFPELHFENALVRNLAHSIKLNMLGYLEAVVISVPIGFMIGLWPICRALVGRYVSISRFLPLTALIGLFILWFGVGTKMKVHFLALGIIVYLVPVVVQRIDEVNQTYIDTIRTHGGSGWKLVKTVFIPDVISKLSDDIRVLVAISWTYIIIAETVNMSEGGIGSLIYRVSRQSRVDMVFALLMVILTVGFIQDKVFQAIDRVLFPHKHLKGGA